MVTLHLYMPKAARFTDIGSGHGCFPPTPIISGSGDVSINGLAAARKGDSLIPHGCGNCPPHGRSISAGSATVSINGKPAARASDAISCGGSVSAGSGDTLIGDAGTGGALKSCMEGASESASAFVKVDFEAFPLPGEARKVADFTMAAYGGPETLNAHIMKEAQTLAGAQLESLQSAAFTPALASLGIDPAHITQDVMRSAASGAPLQDALIAQVNNAAGGSLSSHLTQFVQPQLTQALIGQATSAIKGGHLAPEALLGSGFVGTSDKASLSSAIGTAAQNVLSKNMSLDAATAALAPSLSGITEHAAQAAAHSFVGDTGVAVV